MRFSISQIAPQPWKNGGGSTQELARADGEGAKAQMIWRASLARIDQDGAFSAFPGLARIHCIISGAGLQLSNAAHQLVAEPLKPLHFDGGLDLFAKLKDGACQAFNLIYDPNLIRAEMRICGAGAHRLEAAEHLVYVLEGSLRLDLPTGQLLLGQGEGWQGAGPLSIDIAARGRAVLLSLDLGS